MANPIHLGTLQRLSGHVHYDLLKHQNIDLNMPGALVDLTTRSCSLCRAVSDAYEEGWHAGALANWATHEPAEQER